MTPQADGDAHQTPVEVPGPDTSTAAPRSDAPSTDEPGVERPRVAARAADAGTDDLRDVSEAMERLDEIPLADRAEVFTAAQERLVSALRAVDAG